MQKAEIEKKFSLIETDAPMQITKNLWFLGEIPRINDFESLTTTFEDENGLDDFVPDDSALAAVLDNQLIIITGCSHSGICNICEQAKKVMGISKINTVIGGFHLKSRNHQTQKTIEYFRENEVKKVFPSHCTYLPALTAFYAEFKFNPIKTGMVFEF